MTVIHGRSLRAIMSQCCDRKCRWVWCKGKGSRDSRNHRNHGNPRKPRNVLSIHPHNPFDLQIFSFRNPGHENPLCVVVYLMHNNKLLQTTTSRFPQGSVGSIHPAVLTNLRGNNYLAAAAAATKERFIGEQPIVVHRCLFPMSASSLFKLPKAAPYPCLAPSILIRDVS